MAFWKTALNFSNKLENARTLFWAWIMVLVGVGLLCFGGYLFVKSGSHCAATGSGHQSCAASSDRSGGLKLAGAGVVFVVLGGILFHPWFRPKKHWLVEVADTYEDALAQQNRQGANQPGYPAAGAYPPAQGYPAGGYSPAQGYSPSGHPATPNYAAGQGYPPQSGHSATPGAQPSGYQHTPGAQPQPGYQPTPGVQPQPGYQPTPGAQPRPGYQPGPGAQSGPGYQAPPGYSGAPGYQQPSGYPAQPPGSYPPPGYPPQRD
ncbi:hypothetical protein [Nocardia arthritidis]|uniref:Uncharacterized protein n=1 Tax=Nocardia arthritidis TaxID=228602 RepID=A0A6G9YIX1_9NOCA|nr:hypothetical protein [Nocardia arthritidis]QIS13134.1 hypothetical protein F5544_26400 [Nocardia arthritidis]